VGLSGVAVNTVVLFALTEFAGVFYLVSSAIATETAIVSNYLLNNAWSFSEVEPQSRGLLRFNAVSLCGLALTVTTLAVVTELGSVHYLVANVFAVGSGATWNYLASSRWVWARPVEVVEAVEAR
jgi:dolichol-phosphate mannosyltransferase